MTKYQNQQLSWFQIFRLGIVQLGIGGMVVITTSTLNRVMVVELLLISGRSLPEIMMMLVPEAWEKHNSMSDVKKAFYNYGTH